MQERIAYQGITFDDVLLEPGFSDVVPRDVDVRTQLTRNIRLNLPVVSKTPEEAAGHFGWFARFAALDFAASSARTRKILGWQPTQPGLIPDIDRPRYFET